MSLDNKSKPDLSDRTTNRLICDDCYKTVCCISFSHSEHKFLEELGNVLCEKCDAKSRDKIWAIKQKDKSLNIIGRK